MFKKYLLTYIKLHSVEMKLDYLSDPLSTQHRTWHMISAHRHL